MFLYISRFCSHCRIQSRLLSCFADGQQIAIRAWESSVVTHQCQLAGKGPAWFDCYEILGSLCVEWEKTGKSRRCQQANSIQS